MSQSSYQALLDSVFGIGQCRVSGKVSIDNIPIAYINANRPDTKPFVDNFVERLVRLKSIYSNDEHSMKHIRKLAAAVGAQDGQGAYAELGALDFIGRMYKTIIGKPALLNQDLPATSTFAGPTRKKANVDGLIQEGLVPSLVGIEQSRSWCGFEQSVSRGLFYFIDFFGIYFCCFAA